MSLRNAAQSSLPSVHSFGTSLPSRAGYLRQMRPMVSAEFIRFGRRKNSRYRQKRANSSGVLLMYAVSRKYWRMR